MYPKNSSYSTGRAEKRVVISFFLLDDCVCTVCQCASYCSAQQCINRMLSKQSVLLVLDYELHRNLLKGISRVAEDASLLALYFAAT